MVKLRWAENDVDIAVIRELFDEYAESLGFDLSFQDFHKEQTTLPGEYSPPGGRLLLAMDEGVAAGCVALRPESDDICEMKRLYIRPAYRKTGLGRKLACDIINEARAIGYKRMRLDTVPAMVEAITLYRSLGFKDIPSYRFNPIEGAICMELELT
jgi:ribosomal protein S18 acetylase RimI-like enzyme